MKAVSLVELCVEKVSKSLLCFASEDLASLPTLLAEEVVKRVLGREWPPPLLHELLILCEAFWKPSSLSLHRHLTPLNSRSLSYLSYTPCLVKLDLSSNAWLDSLEFLPLLAQLECLNLRDCWHLPERTLGYIGGLQKLSCLDMENVYSLTDASAAAFLPGIYTLRSLNLSGTGISDGSLDALTYGQRLRAWVSKEQSAKFTGVNASRTGSFEHAHNLGMASQLQQWKPLELVCLRLQHTKITEAALHFILAFEQLLFLDVRNTEIPGRSLKSLQARQKLISLPNNAKLLARWNSMFVTVFHGCCGCSLLGSTAPSAQGVASERHTDHFTRWEQDGVKRLLTTASRQASSASNT